MIFKKIIVKGYVQGVCYRYYTQKKAKELGIIGYVKNKKDYTVEIAAKGKKLNEFISWCKKGPEFAKVNSLDFQDIDSDAEFSDFKIIQ